MYSVYVNVNIYEHYKNTLGIHTYTYVCICDFCKDLPISSFKSTTNGIVPFLPQELQSYPSNVNI